MKHPATTVAGAVALLSLLSGCGLSHPLANAHLTHRPKAHAVQAPTFHQPPPGHVTKMGPLDQRLQVVDLAKVPRWTFQTPARKWTASVIQGSNTLIVNLDAPPGPLWSELASAQKAIARPVTIIATDWPPGTTLAEAQHVETQVLGAYHIKWPIVYALHAPMVPTPMAIFQRPSGTVDLLGITPSAADWVNLLNGSPKLPQKG